jgi:2-dehydro-3-deoxy-D-arabinonate dehydratase
MLLVKFLDGSSPRVGLLDEDGLRPLRSDVRLTEILDAAAPAAAATQEIDQAESPRDPATVQLLAPIDDQEVWGAGVTYLRSKIARQEESESGGSFYDLVYSADRPELFFKATPGRVVGPKGAVRMRADTKWCVPEPELALVLNSSLRWVGCTVGNDMSARDIEGRNPLYLPQAKLYQDCCALGPGIALLEGLPDPSNLAIRLEVGRAGQMIVREETSTARMARKFEELIDWLGRDNRFPTGAILLTGTGIVPPDEFSLQDGDLVSIAIEGIGVLENRVYVESTGA